MKDNNNSVVPAYVGKREIPAADILYIFTGRMCSKIKTRDIEFIEKDMRKITINTFNNEYEVYEALEIVEKYLKGKNFYKPLKGIILNFDHIKNIDDDTVTFDSGRTIMFGRNTIIKTKNEFKNYVRDAITYDINQEELLVAENIKKG